MALQNDDKRPKNVVFRRLVQTRRHNSLILKVTGGGFYTRDIISNINATRRWRQIADKEGKSVVFLLCGYQPKINELISLIFLMAAPFIFVTPGGLSLVSRHPQVA